jgi:hypothetical protein
MKNHPMRRKNFGADAIIAWAEKEPLTPEQAQHVHRVLGIPLEDLLPKGADINGNGPRTEAAQIVTATRTGASTHEVLGEPVQMGGAHENLRRT